MTQNFHWEPQEGACIGGRGISKITDQNLMYQFEAGWEKAFGFSYSTMPNNSQPSKPVATEKILTNNHAMTILRRRISDGGNSQKWTTDGFTSAAHLYTFSAAHLCFRTKSGIVYFIGELWADKMQKCSYIMQIDINEQRLRMVEGYLQPNIMYGDQRQIEVETLWETDASLSSNSGKNITFVSRYCAYLKEHLKDVPIVED